MKVLGIIAEYNPFHCGHRYHLEESLKVTGADCTVAVMSGDFTQRGEPAIIDKWTRAEMAVRNGIDLVLELPFIFACNNAEYFAYGGVGILDGLGCVTHFSFGSEQGNTENLLRAANLLSDETEEFRLQIRQMLEKGFSYPKARYEALLACGEKEAASILLEPNNILAVAYLRQWQKRKSEMIPVAVKRYGAGYSDPEVEEGQFASASGVRKLLLAPEGRERVLCFVPSETAEILKRLEPGEFLSADSFLKMILYRILTENTTELAGLMAAGEGLENRLKEASQKSGSIRELIAAVKSKRYTETRVCRLLVHTLLDFKKEFFFQALREELLYARVLAVSAKGETLLRHIRKAKTNSIPVVTNINRQMREDKRRREVLQYDILASDLCNLERFGEIGSRSDHVRTVYRKPAED